MIGAPVNSIFDRSTTERPARATMNELFHFPFRLQSTIDVMTAASAGSEYINRSEYEHRSVIPTVHACPTTTHYHAQTRQI